jgi:hypothetical protein
MSTEQTAPGRTTPVTQIRRDSFTSLHGRPQWVTLHLATAAEQHTAAGQRAAAGGNAGMFWLDGDGQPYTGDFAHRLSDRLARVVHLTDEQLAASPQAFDALLSEHYERYERISASLEGIRNSIHRAAGDRQDWHGRMRLWRRTDAEAEQTLRSAIALPELDEALSREAARLFEQQGQLRVEQAQALLAVREMEAVYRKAPWARYFPCTNRDGHIHSSYRDCPSVQWDTAMAWRPDLSGLTVEEAVQMPPKGLGYALCSICFPLAPVEYKSMTTGQVELERTRAERDAARAERQAVKNAKQLAGDEQFRDTSGRVTTVAGAVKVLRDEVEFRDYYGRGEHPSHAETAVAAARAAEVLLAREAAHPGWGKTQAEIDKIIASAVKRNIKDGARLDPETGRSLA